MFYLTDFIVVKLLFMEKNYYFIIYQSQFEDN